MSFRALCRRIVFALGALLAPVLHAWDQDGHAMVNELALRSLPPEFPEFARTGANARRVVMLASVPDRWRNVDPYLRQSGGSWTDHFIDMEELTQAGLDPKTVPSLRYNFLLLFAAGRVAYAEKFPAIDPARNLDHVREWPGFLPWSIAEHYHRLRSAFSYLKAYQDLGGTEEEIANAKADVVQAMGVLGHYVGDSAQPLHTTWNYNGWTAENPIGYTNWNGFHTWVDSGFIAKAGIVTATLAPRMKQAEVIALGPRADGRDPFFVAAMDYVLAQWAQVEPLYQLEKEGLLGNGDRPIMPEGRAFFEERLLTGGTMLGRIWLTAWKTAPVDTFLSNRLGQRQAGGAGKRPKASK
jgi:hypothetical protein